MTRISGQRVPTRAIKGRIIRDAPVRDVTYDDADFEERRFSSVGSGRHSSRRRGAFGARRRYFL
jgi:hypothetical protein